MLSAYKYRPYSGVIQIAMFAKHFGVSHYRYNWVLKINNGYDRLSSKNLYKRKRPIQTQKRHYTISMLVDDTKVSPEKAQITEKERLALTLVSNIVYVTRFRGCVCHLGK